MKPRQWSVRSTILRPLLCFAVIGWTACRGKDCRNDKQAQPRTDNGIQQEQEVSTRELWDKRCTARSSQPSQSQRSLVQSESPEHTLYEIETVVTKKSQQATVATIDPPAARAWASRRAGTRAGPAAPGTPREGPEEGRLAKALHGAPAVDRRWAAASAGSRKPLGGSAAPELHGSAFALRHPGEIVFVITQYHTSRSPDIPNLSCGCGANFMR